MSYRDLEIWKLAHELVIDIQVMTINHLPKYELYEEGGQIRRSFQEVDYFRKEVEFIFVNSRKISQVYQIKLDL